MKTFKLSLVLHTRENTDVFITLDDNIYGIHRKRVNILYLEGYLTNSADPVQTPRNAASGQGLHYLLKLQEVMVKGKS